MTPVPHPLYSPNLKRKSFANVEQLEQKAAEALKGIKIDKCKNWLEQWKKTLIGVLHQMESTLNVTEV